MTRRPFRRIIVGVLLAGSALLPQAQGASSQNQPGAFLVYPLVLVESPPGSDQHYETFITITNLHETNSYVGYVAFWNGDSGDPQYCGSCDFSFALGPRDSDTFVFKTFTGSNTEIRRLGDVFSMFCAWENGFVTVALEDIEGNTVYDDVLSGDAVVVDYLNGQSLSVPAIPFPGGSGDGDRVYEFDDVEYGKLPRIVAAEFMTPNGDGTLDTYLTLFTLNFEAQVPPLVDCSVTAFDAQANPMSTSLQFGCWTHVRLRDVSPAFAYPNFGSGDGTPDENGWLMVNCRTGGTTDGGVHGVISQVAASGTVLLRNDAGPFVAAPVSWGRLLLQSVTTGDSVSLDLEIAP